MCKQSCSESETFLTPHSSFSIYQKNAKTLVGDICSGSTGVLTWCNHFGWGVSLTESPVSLESTQLIQNCTWNITKQNYRFKSPFSSELKRNLFSLNWYLQNYSVKGKQSWLIFSCRKTVQADAVFCYFFVVVWRGGKDKSSSIWRYFQKQVMLIILNWKRQSSKDQV